MAGSIPRRGGAVQRQQQVAGADGIGGLRDGEQGLGSIGRLGAVGSGCQCGSANGLDQDALRGGRSR